MKIRDGRVSVYDLKVRGYAKALYAWLERRIPLGGEADIEIAEMVAKVGFSRRTITRGLKELLDARVLSRARNITTKGIVASTYVLRDVRQKDQQNQDGSDRPTATRVKSSKAVCKKHKSLSSLLQQPKPESSKLESSKLESSKLESSKLVLSLKESRGFCSDPKNPAGFALVWEVYPRKVKLDAAVRAWDRLAPDDTLANTMLDAIAAQSRSRAWKDPDYIPFLCNWLDGRRWEDEVPAVLPLSTKGQSNLVAAQDWISRRRAAAVTVEAEPAEVELQEA